MIDKPAKQTVTLTLIDEPHGMPEGCHFDMRLKQALKVLLRRFGLRNIGCQDVVAPDPKATVADGVDVG